MLNNSYLQKEAIESLRDIPNEKDKHTYQSKVEIYDRKCKGCGFMCVFVVSSTGKEYKMEKVEDAISLAMSIPSYKGMPELVRTCEYPGNITDSDKGDIYPTLTEIIMNTCKLWDAKNIESNDEVLTDMENKQLNVEVNYDKISERQLS